MSETTTRRPPTTTVGGRAPDNSLIRFVRSIAFLDRDLQKGEEIHVQILDTAGNVVGNGYATVDSIEFRDNRDKDGHVVSTDRVALVKLT